MRLERVNCYELVALTTFPTTPSFKTPYSSLLLKTEALWRNGKTYLKVDQA